LILAYKFFEYMRSTRSKTHEMRELEEANAAIAKLESESKSKPVRERKAFPVSEKKVEDKREEENPEPELETKPPGVSSEQYLQDLSKELHKPVRHKFQTRKVFARSKDATWGMDLADMSHWKEENDGYTYILNVFTRWASARPLRTKTGVEVLNGIQSVISESKRKPNFFWVDEGKEFLNKDMNAWRKTQAIGLYHTYGRGKSVVVERFNRTLKTIMWKTLTAKNSHAWVAELPSLIKKYNSTIHTTLAMSPNHASSKPEAAEKRWEELKKKVRKVGRPKYVVGDIVRVSRSKGVFEKGYDVSWSREQFTVVSVDVSRSPVVYHLKDRREEDIKGSFYAEELQKVKHTDTFLIDKVIDERGRGKKKELFVSWLGYGPEWNSWIAAAATVAL
jgi:hypothetical protein